MDIATIIGLLSGAGLILSAILMGGSAGMFINIPGLMIVVGGTMAATLIKFTLMDVLGSMGTAYHSLGKRSLARTFY